MCVCMYIMYVYIYIYVCVCVLCVMCVCDIWYKMVSNQQTAQERNTKSTSLYAWIDIHLPSNC